MECLVTLCFVSSIYVNGAMGFQPNQLGDNWLDDFGETNQYGYHIGELSLVVEFNNNLYLEAKHISGLNTAESDLGLNAIMVGAKIYFLRNEQ